ncbi:HupE/UreJ family protein [Microvirga aerilata]|uniref:HupE/UreJ family protein n=1 Tax=Microvirga aerilata TaxID=670292 RepID=A0A936ZFN9_9HYPH|nr:HupE/UreJ family protein [Microvirga aerilata]
MARCDAQSAALRRSCCRRLRFFGGFHDYAHGTEIAPAVSPANYSAGFLLASALLLGSGAVLEGAIRGISAMSRVFGGGIALVGAALFFV